MIYKAYTTLKKALITESRLRRLGYFNPRTRLYKGWYEVRYD